MTAPAPETPVFTYGLDAAVKKAIADVPDGKTRQVTLGATLTGAEVSFGWKTGSLWNIGGYAKKLWGGGYEAGARATRAW